MTCARTTAYVFSLLVGVESCGRGGSGVSARDGGASDSSVARDAGSASGGAFIDGSASGGAVRDGSTGDDTGADGSAGNGYAWNNVAIGGGGYVIGLYMSPLRQDLLYIRTDVGGFYRWAPPAAGADDGQWLPLLDWQPLSTANYSAEGAALDPAHADVVYLALGGSGGNLTNGVFLESQDQGGHWTDITAGAVVPMDGNGDLRWDAERLAVDPTTPGHILFGSRTLGLLSFDGTSWTSGAAASNLPLGRTGAPNYDGITTVLFDSATPGLVFANVYGDGVYQSTDAGVMWSRLSGSPSMASRLALATDGTLYATAASAPVVSKYVGGVWTDLTPNCTGCVTRAGFGGLAVNPTDPADIFVVQEQSSPAQIQRYLHGTWTLVKTTSQSEVPWWPANFFSQHASSIAFDPFRAGVLWLADWFGVWSTTNIDASPAAFSSHEHGHEEVVTLALAAPPSPAPVLLSGVADVHGFQESNVASLDQFPSTASTPFEQDTNSIDWCASDPSFLVRVMGNRSNTGPFGFSTSNTAGATWSPLTTFSSMPLDVAVSATSSMTFVVTVAGAVPVATQNGGTSFANVTTLPASAPVATSEWKPTVPLAADRVSQRFYYFDGAGGAFYTSTDGMTFAKSASSPPAIPGYPRYRVKSGVADGDVWVSVNGTGTGGLYHSASAGGLFTKITGVTDIQAVDVTPGASASAVVTIYGTVAGTSGVYQSDDGGVTWRFILDPAEQMSDGPAEIAASWQSPGLVFVGTGGRGIFYGMPR